MSLAHQRMGEGRHHVWILHGILGSGRNWRSFARRVSETGSSVVLVDHRFHGDSGPRPAPHTVDACADDVAELAAEIGAPDLLIGHSFGGKVALSYSQRHGVRDLAVLDSVPSVPDRPQIPANNEVLAVIAALRLVPTPASDRGAVARQLESLGLAQGVVRWLVTSLRQGADGWDWVYDLDAIEHLIEDYLQRDAWSALQTPSFRRGLVVRALRSDRWSAEDVLRLSELPPSVRVEALDAGHWVQVDDPEGLFRALVPLLESP